MTVKRAFPRKIRRALRTLLKSAASWADEILADPADVLPAKIDRTNRGDNLRPATIMHVDLVGSSILCTTQGEKYYGLLEDFKAGCEKVVVKYGGRFTSKPGDDSCTCYFGIPLAYEDSPARAVRAGLEIIKSVTNTNIRMRIGIATGQVVVKARNPADMNDFVATGPDINLAARLQESAAPGTLRVSVGTHQIVRDKFDFERVVPTPVLKDIPDVSLVYRVLREKPDAAPSPTPFVGRQEELRLLQEQWSAVRERGLRTVLILGDAGMGKSRLIREFRRSVSMRSDEVIECRCLADRTASAFYPVIDFLRRLLQIQDTESDKAKLDKIDARLKTISSLDGAASLIANLLSIDGKSRYPPLHQSADRQRQLTLDVLTAWVRKESERTPICFILEDVQWIDPSTRDFVNRLVARAARWPILALITLRAEDEIKGRPRFPVHEMRLRGFSADSARAIIIGASGESTLANEDVRLLTARADGVPLFLEESTRMAVELRANNIAGELRSAVPTTIHDLLRARLDRLGLAALQVAQMGAVIGREFPLTLLEAVADDASSPTRIHNLLSRLDLLVDSGLLIEKDKRPNASYYFKHSLVCDAAYQSLLSHHRKQYHQAIAAVINSQFKQLATSQPETLAHHYTEAGMDTEAVTLWHQAATRAVSRSAHKEAIKHLKNGLDIIESLPPSEDRDRAELKYRLSLDAPLIATEGYGANQVERVFARARTLSQSVGDENALMKVNFGLADYHLVRGEFQQAHALAVQASEIAERSADPIRRLRSTWTVANILFHQGELVSALEGMQSCLAEYDQMQHRHSAVQDLGILCQCYSAWGKWELGYPDQAMQFASQVVKLSEALNHKFSMGEAYGFCATVQYFRGEYVEALSCAKRAMEICEDGGFVFWLAHAKLMNGRLIAEQGDATGGVKEMAQAYKMWTAMGAVATSAFYLALQAEGLSLAGRPDEGIDVLQKAFEIVCGHGERYYEAEIRRLTGELILQSAAARGVNRSYEAETWLLSAIEFAQTKHLFSLTLRAATSLARLWMSQGRCEDAIRVVEPVYGWFREGPNTRDLQQARALLAALQTTAAPARIVH